MAVGMSRDELVSGLVRVGELEITGDDQAAVDAYFAPDFRFHGPDRRELDYQGLQSYFSSLRAAFDDRIIQRGIVIVEGNYVACQTTIAGTFVREFTQSPVGPLPPNGQRVTISPTSSVTTMQAAWPRSGSRLTAAASSASSAPRAGEPSMRDVTVSTTLGSAGDPAVPDASHRGFRPRYSDASGRLVGEAVCAGCRTTTCASPVRSSRPG
jgi:hypothetical protein